MNKRNPNMILTEILNNLDFNKKRDIFFWDEFYEFIIASYKVGVSFRYSISMLGEYLKENNISNKREIIECYIHSMNILAKMEGEKLYGNGFYIW